ncbi:hypothetical protein F4775DRAFT_559510 [Biscogniauxia sp. FL1348]|nr:hypothetical protein F4775DRAFT_559510 [Biscogniauxia sp. FL1348]
MECPSIVLCPASTSVIPQVKGDTTQFLTSELAAVLTYIPQNNEYTWTTFTYLPAKPASPRFTAAEFQTPTTTRSSTQQGSQTGALAAETSSSAPTCNTVLNTGAIAGVAVACALLGAIISAITACLFLRRRRQRWAQLARLPSDDTIPEKRVPAATPAPTTAHSLLDSVPESRIVAEFRSLDRLIQQHVADHYHLDPVPCAPDALASSLAPLRLPHPPADLASRALDPRTRRPALRHLIASAAFASVALDANAPISLLPPCIAGFAAAVSADRHPDGKQLHSPTYLSVYLLIDRREKLPPSPSGAGSRLSSCNPSRPPRTRAPCRRRPSPWR